MSDPCESVIYMLNVNRATNVEYQCLLFKCEFNHSQSQQL